MKFKSKILSIKEHTDIDYTFRMEYNGEAVNPRQFFEVSSPKYGEAPISVCEIGDGFDIETYKNSDLIIAAGGEWTCTS